MTLNSDAKFEQTLTLWFQKWHEKLAELSSQFRSYHQVLEMYVLNFEEN